METTLYDASGNPVAYIADDEEHSIYLWEGNAVAYVLDQKVYGWNGDHLGWYVDGVVHDEHGYCVGSTQEKCRTMTFVQPIKNVKYVKYVKNVRSIAYAKPSLSYGSSEKSLRDFLARGQS